MNTEIVESLYKSHYNYFFVIAYRICESVDMAQDIIHDGFIGALRTEEVFTDSIHARKYLTGCIKNAAFKRIAKDKRIKAMRVDFLQADRGPDLRGWLIASIQKIRHPLAKVIVRERYVNGKTQKEILSIYGISKGYAINLENKAIKQLKLIMV